MASKTVEELETENEALRAELAELREELVTARKLVSQVMDAPFPMVEDHQPAESVAKVLSKSNPAVLVRSNGKVTGIVTRSDLLSYLMSR